MQKPTPEHDYHGQEVIWRKDVHAFASALFRHWLWWTSTTVSSGIAAMLAASIPGWKGSIPSPILWLSALSGFVVASFLGFRDQRRIIEEKEARVRSLEGEVNTLMASLDQRQRQKEIQNRLGGFHQGLLARSREIESITCFEYANKYPDAFERKQLDPDSATLLEDVRTFLDVFVGGAAIAIFLDRIEFQPRQNYNSNIMAEKNNYQDYAIELLNKRAAQLMKIIEQFR